jgi:O-antigen/teichoic acid export membrane protein
VPLCWQGWAVLAAYLAVIVAAGVDLAAKGHMAAFNGAVVIATIALIAICWIKGEPPRWRWGNDSTKRAPRYGAPFLIRDCV